MQLASNRGETLIETITAMLILTMVLAIIIQMSVISQKYFMQAKDMSDSFYSDLGQIYRSDYSSLTMTEITASPEPSFTVNLGGGALDIYTPIFPAGTKQYRTENGVVFFISPTETPAGP